MRFFTIGHGTRSVEELVMLLGEGPAQTLVDVRRHPGSRRNPQWSRTSLETTLPPLGVRYLYRGDALGGRRAAKSDSRHVAWENDSFRGYADWMETRTFREAIAELEREAASGPLAIMCAETLWWRCHRRLISDALVARGHRVIHLVKPGGSVEHVPTPSLRVESTGALVYDRGVGLVLFPGGDHGDDVTFIGKK